MALVFSEILVSASLRSIIIVLGSISQKTGVAPDLMIEEAVVTNVNEGVRTSSPGPKSSSKEEISSAAVQLWVSRTLLQEK